MLFAIPLGAGVGRDRRVQLLMRGQEALASCASTALNASVVAAASGAAGNIAHTTPRPSDQNASDPSNAFGHDAADVNQTSTGVPSQASATDGSLTTAVSPMTNLTPAAAAISATQVTAGVSNGTAAQCANISGQTFNYDPPFLRTVVPSVGPRWGGRMVTLLGADFGPGSAEDGLAAFMGTGRCESTWVSDGEVTCVTLADGDDVTVNVGGQQSQDVRFFLLPQNILSKQL